MEIIQHLRRIIKIQDKQTRILIFIGIFLFALSSVFEIIGLGLLFPVVQILTLENLDSSHSLIKWAALLLNTNDPLFLAAAGVFSIAFLLVLKAVLTLSSLYWFNKKITEAEYIFSSQLYGAFLKASMQWHRNQNSAHLFRGLRTSCAATFSASLLTITQVSADAVLSLGMLFMLFYVDPIPALISIGIGFIGAYITNRILGPKTVDIGRRSYTIEMKEHKLLLESLNGIQEVRTLARENYFLTKYWELRKELLPVNYLSRTFNQMPKLMFEVIAGFYLAGIFCYLIIQYERTEVIAILAIYAVAAMRVLPAIARMTSQMNMLRKYFPGVIDITDYIKYFGVHFDRNTPIADQFKNRNRTFKMKSNMSIENVTFGYDENTPILNDISMNINQGNSIGIVGPSGSGKSTAIGVILGFLTPQKGTIKIDGKTVDHDISAYERSIGFVPQSVALMDRSIRNNIAFGIDDEVIDDAEIWSVLKDVQLSEFVAKLPEGLDTFIGESGVRLSGGQRQRLGIARALYDDSDILILDEATSSLDTETEAQIVSVLKGLHGRKTLITIAHRLSTIQYCDEIYFMQNGVISEKGTFKTLSENNADFKKLVDHGKLDA